MGSAKANHKEEIYTENVKEVQDVSSESLKGTFISVGVVGLVILIVYVIIFSLYMSRV